MPPYPQSKKPPKKYYEYNLDKNYYAYRVIIEF